MRARALIGFLLATALTAPVAAAPPGDEPASAPPTPEEIAPQGQSTDDLLLNREQYFYSSFGRRDPFGSLLKGKYARTEDQDLLDVGELTLVGVVWGDEDKFAVVEDKRDNSHVLREGDRVVNGKVIEISRTSLTVQHFFFGETANVTITMNGGVGNHEAR